MHIFLIGECVVYVYHIKSFATVFLVVIPKFLFNLSR
jgi:hypothetical protein